MKGLKKNVSLVLVAAAMLLTGCGGQGQNTSEVQKVIDQAEKMDEEQLYKKAAAEIGDNKFIVIANSSRMKDAFPAWCKYVNEKYGGHLKTDGTNFQTTQPKNNQIFTQIKGDVTGTNHSISMTLIQDGSQIASKMTKTGYLLNYIPKEWKTSGADEAKDGHPLALQSLSKVFAYNSNNADGTPDSYIYDNVFDYAINDEGKDVHTQFMAPASEPVGANMFYMLTKPEYSAIVKDAYDHATDAQKAKIDKTIADSNAGIADEIKDLGKTSDPNLPYALAWEYLFLKNYQAEVDDGPIAGNITKKNAAGQSALLVYSKFRSTKETDETSNKQIRVSAYLDGYHGFGGYMYKHYLQVLSTSPYPWTSCAFIHFMTNHAEGFKPWGKDMGGYSANPKVQAQFDHSTDGDKEGVPIKNDKGYAWWTANEQGKGRLIIEDGEYCSSVASSMGEWMKYLR